MIGAEAIKFKLKTGLAVPTVTSAASAARAHSSTSSRGSRPKYVVAECQSTSAIEPPMALEHAARGEGVVLAFQSCFW